MRGLFWFRNDLRLADNRSLDALVARVEEWLPVFVLDDRLLAGRNRSPARTRFLLDCLGRLGSALGERGVPLQVCSGRPERVLPALARETGARLLAFNRSATPFARERDAEVRRAVEGDGVSVISHLDHVVFDASEVRSASGGAYSVYTPYRRAWWRRWREEPRRPTRAPRLPPPIPGFAADPLPDPADLGAAGCDVALPTGGSDAARRRLAAFLDGPVRRYAEDRDVPGIDGTSRLSAYLRFGAISVRTCFERAEEAARIDPGLAPGVDRWLDELIWREFYASILEANPRVLRGAHRREYDGLVWNDDASEFDAWCRGRTGFPFVDAAMRQLNATGWMHNRARMVSASFLTKDLLIDWRDGERLFMERLVDGDPAQNNGGWQWAASTGTDAQPYFRIFNPVTQSRRWDPDGRYIRRWVPELRALGPREIHEPWKVPMRAPDYPPPIVDHAERRELALERYRDARARAAS